MKQLHSDVIAILLTLLVVSVLNPSEMIPYCDAFFSLTTSPRDMFSPVRSSSVESSETSEHLHICDQQIKRVTPLRI